MADIDLGAAVSEVYFSSSASSLIPGRQLSLALADVNAQVVASSVIKGRKMTVIMPIDVVILLILLRNQMRSHPTLGPSIEIGLSAMLSVFLPPPAPNPAIVQTRTIRIFGPIMPEPVLDDRGRPT